MSLISRTLHQSQLINALLHFPVVSLTGPRQCGKRTLARQIAAKIPGGSVFIDLESPQDMHTLPNPQYYLAEQRGLVIVSGADSRPELLPIIGQLADRAESPAKFLLISSSSHFAAEVAQALGEQVKCLETTPMHFSEIAGAGGRGGGAARNAAKTVTAEDMDMLWLRGGFPASWLAESDKASFTWRENYLQTFLLQEMAVHVLERQLAALRRFLLTLANYHGQILNASELARSLGLTPVTVRKHLKLLQEAHLLRLLPPWPENFGKRLIKAPKVYLRDSGLYHALLGLESRNDLWRSHKAGCSWEGFALEQTLALAPRLTAYFWALHSGAAVDLFLQIDRQRVGLVFRWNERPATSKAMHAALDTLGLDKLYIVYPGRQHETLTERIAIVPLIDVGAIVAPKAKT